MKNIKLTTTDLERLWILAEKEAENSKEGSKKQKIYSELSQKLYNANK